MRLSVVLFILFSLAACSESDQSAPEPPSGLPVNTDAQPVVRHSNRDSIDLQTLPASLADDTRLEVERLVDAARRKRQEAAEWLGKAVEIERQAREFEKGGEEQRSRDAREQASRNRQLAKRILAEARMADSQARELVSGAADATPADSSTE